MNVSLFFQITSSTFPFKCFEFKNDDCCCSSSLSFSIVLSSFDLLKRLLFYRYRSIILMLWKKCIPELFYHDWKCGFPFIRINCPCLFHNECNTAMKNIGVFLCEMFNNCYCYYILTIIAIKSCSDLFSLHESISPSLILVLFTSCSFITFFNWKYVLSFKKPHNASMSLNKTFIS